MTGFRAVLTYHSIDSSESPISVSAAAFAGHVRVLASGSPRVMRLETLVAEVRAGTATPGDAVALTFDDGFANFAQSAAPMLAEHGLPATVFVVSGHVGRTNAWNGRSDAGIPTLPLLDWDAVGRLRESGFDVGAHTRTHPVLDALSPNAVVDEIEGSASDIERYSGRRPNTFAYPYGVAPASAANCVRREYAVGVTTQMRALSAGDDGALIPRLDAYYLRRPQALDGWGTLPFRGYLRLRASARALRKRVSR